MALMYLGKRAMNLGGEAAPLLLPESAQIYKKFKRIGMIF